MRWQVGTRWIRSVSVVMAVTLSGCVFGPSGDEKARTIATSFFEQVNGDTCDEAPGFGIDDDTWAEACNAVVADMSPASSLSSADLTETDFGETRVEFSLSAPYPNIDDVPTKVYLTFNADGFLATGATLTRILSRSTAAIGETDIFDVGDPVDPVEPDGRELIQQVQTLLLDGRCDDIDALLAPTDEFPGAADIDQCESLASLYANHPPVAGDGEWTSVTYSVVDLNYADLAYDVERVNGETQSAYRNRVVAFIKPNNRKVRLHTDTPGLTIDAVLYEGQWYLLNVDMFVDTLRFEF